MATLKELEGHAVKALRKKPQTLEEIAVRVGKGITMKQLARPIGELVKRGEALKVGTSPSTYTKV